MAEEVQQPKRSFQSVMFFTSGIAFGVGCLLIGQGLLAPPHVSAREPQHYIAKLVAANLEMPESIQMLERLKAARLNPAVAGKEPADSSEPLPCVEMPTRTISGSTVSRSIPFATGEPITIEPIRPAVPPAVGSTPSSTPTNPSTPNAPASAINQVTQLVRKYNATMPAVNAQKATIVVRKADSSSLLEDLTDLKLLVVQTQSKEVPSTEVARIQQRIDEAQAKRQKVADLDERKKLDDAIEVLQFDLKKASAKSPPEVLVTFEVSLVPVEG